jgi:hypothetical protein
MRIGQRKGVYINAEPNQGEMFGRRQNVILPIQTEILMTQETVRIVALVLLLVVVAIIFLRRKGKKKNEDDF